MLETYSHPNFCFPLVSGGRGGEINNEQDMPPTPSKPMSPLVQPRSATGFSSEGSGGGGGGGAGLGASGSVTLGSTGGSKGGDMGGGNAPVWGGGVCYYR